MALDWLMLFAHWVTPDIEPRRFDAYFFLAVEPEAQDASHCGRETTLARGCGPARPSPAAGRRDRRCRRRPGRRCGSSEPFGTVDEAVAWARTCPVPRIQPKSIFQGSTRIVTLPGDPAPGVVPGFSPRETRFAIENGRWRPIEPGRPYVGLAGLSRAGFSPPCAYPTWTRGRRCGSASNWRSTSRVTGAVSPSPNARNFSR